MAVLQRIRDFFIPLPVEPERVVRAPSCEYAVRPLTDQQLNEVLLLNRRCFRKGENYNKQTFSFLLSEPSTLSYRAVTPEGKIVGFIFITVSQEATGHITTIGVAPEHRRRGLAQKLLLHAEQALINREINTIFLEVRVDNTAAQNLYRRLGYSIVQRLPEYYNSGDDGFLMVKSLFQK